MSTLVHEHPAQQMDIKDQRRARFFLIASVALVGFTMSLQIGLNGNFVAQTMHLSGLQQGLLDELPHERWARRHD